MLIGGKPAGNETKRSSKKQRSNAQKDDSTSVTATAVKSSEATTDTQTTNEKVSAPAAVTSSSSSSTTSSSNATKENNDPKSLAVDAATTTTTATTTESNNDASTNNSNAGGNGNNSTNATSSNSANSNGINKKIPKQKWRPLQIDLAKSSRSKSIGRPTRRGISSQQRYQQERGPNRSSGIAESNNDRRSNNSNNNGETPRDRSNLGSSSNSKTKSGNANERVDSWRVSGGAEREYERPMRTQRRFRTSYRGGRQGRGGGGFSRSGPGRTTNRLPRHLLANGEYANYLPADAAGADPSFVLMGTHYYGPMPAGYIEMDAHSVKEAIKKQV